MEISFDQNRFNGAGFSAGSPELAEYPTLVGTRATGVHTADYHVPVELIADRIARGEGEADLARELGVTIQAIREAVAYVAHRGDD